MNKVQMVQMVKVGGGCGYHLLSELGHKTLCGQDARGAMIQLGSLVNVVCEECNFVYDMSKQPIRIGKDRKWERKHIIRSHGKPYCGQESIWQVFVGGLEEVTCAKCYKLYWNNTIAEWREANGRTGITNIGGSIGVPVVEANKASPEVVSQPIELTREMWEKVGPEVQWLLYKLARQSN